MTPWLLALLARAVLILPPLSQHLTFPLLSVTLLVSFGSSMLYGYNLAVVNSPAEVRVGQPLWEQGKWLCIPPLEGGVTAVQKPHAGIFLEQQRGIAWEGRQSPCSCTPNWSPEKGGPAKLATTSLLQLECCL